MRPGPPIARSRRGRLAAAVSCVALLGGGASALPAGAQDDPFGADEGKNRADRAIAFLQDVQNADGGLPQQRGGDSDPSVSAWAALAVAAARISPRDQTVKGGTSLWEYLQEESGELQSSDDLARLALVARAAKSSPERVGDVTPIKTITARQSAEGGIADAGSGKISVATTAWAVLALPAGEARTKARRWLVGARNPKDGGWPATPGGASDAVATGLALQALRRTVPATTTFGFLRSIQRAGGLPRRKGGDPDALATALVIQGGVAAGSASDRQQLSLGTNDPTSFLWKRQEKSGAVGSVLATAQVAPALAARPYPLAAVSSKGPTNTGTPVEDEEPEDTTTNEVEPTDPVPDETSTGPNAVEGGQGDADSDGTTATGGGSGAPGDVAGAAPPATTSAAPPTTTTTAAAPPTTTTPGDQVTGSVVGSTDAAPAAATADGGGGDGDDEDRTALALLGAIVLFVILGAWLERRPSRVRGVAS